MIQFSYFGSHFFFFLIVIRVTLLAYKESAYKAGGLDSILGKLLLVKGMATHCSILAWRIPWTEEPGRLYSSWGPKESDRTEQLTFLDYLVMLFTQEMHL